MRSIINGNEVEYVDVGDSRKPVVILIHGFPFSHKMWDPQIEILKEREFRVVAYDMRGHGGSGVGDGQYMLEFYVDDLIGLLDYLKIEKAVLCGLSMGGYVALRAVERNPERVLALILCDTQAKADSNEAKLKRAAAIKAVKSNGVHVYAETFAEAVFAPQTLTTKGDLVQKIKAIIESNSATGICGALLALASRTETTDALSRISVPTLILVGDQDAITPPGLSMEIHSRIANSELHRIPNAGHMSNLENREEFNQHVLNFLRKIAI